jgi:photosystem II stability/assembly factor-like uncharacterized protein
MFVTAWRSHECERGTHECVRYVILCLVTASLAFAQAWSPQASGTTASLRGVDAVNARVAWASGSGGTFLTTTNGGVTWRAGTVTGAEQLDFRDIHALDEGTAFMLSSGSGDKSRIYKTTDGGSNWTLLFTNPDAAGFFDAIAFWDARRGIVLGDPVNGEFTIFTTDDGGAHWQRQHTPPALPNEGAFAASGTCLVIRGKREAWFGTGGPGAARVFHSMDGGKSWTVVGAPMRNDSASSGIFSLAFSDARHGIAVGGDYNKAGETAGNVVVTSDGGKTWIAPTGSRPGGFRSAVIYIRSERSWIAVGTSGSDISPDGGITWIRALTTLLALRATASVGRSGRRAASRNFAL